MISLTAVIVGLVALFAFFLAFRLLTGIKICALCAAAASTWLVLLVLFFINQSADPVLIAVLMGGSVVGLMYLLVDKLPERFGIFKLPFFLTGVSLTYVILIGRLELSAGLVLGLLWLLSIILFISRGESNLGRWAQKIIACCKNW